VSVPPLLALEVRLASTLGEAARAARVHEATARILLSLRDEEAVSMGEVATRLARDATTATRFVDRAAAEGYVTRRPGEDRRIRLVALSTTGRQRRAALLAAFERRAAALAEGVQERTGLGREEMEWFVVALLQAFQEASGQ
jgi:DNA-binding MarR family transcriptional regulator